jgi:hypothetical protein
MLNISLDVYARVEKKHLSLLMSSFEKCYIPVLCVDVHSVVSR